MNYSDYFQSQLETYIREFESNLLAWMNAAEDSKPLERLEHTLTHLTMMERREPFRRLWWLGSGMAEAARYSAVDAAPLIKHLFAGILGELKKQRAHPEADRPNAPPEELVEDIMTALKQPEADQAGPIMQNIAREFSLDETAASG